MTQNEDSLSHRQSLELIEEMIYKAKNSYYESGTSALLWGSVIMLCSAIGFANTWWQNGWLKQVWILTIIAIIPQIIISVREGKAQKFKGHTDDSQGGIWIAFGIAMFLATFYINNIKVESASTIFLILYGMPTFATGIGERFTPMIFGGIVCWIAAIISMYVWYRFDMILFFVSAFFAWFLPGLILRRNYLKKKRANV
jgi:hypothetical protein